MNIHAEASHLAEERIEEYDFDGHGTCHQCGAEDVDLHDESTCRPCMGRNLADGIALELQMGTPPEEVGR